VSARETIEAITVGRGFSNSKSVSAKYFIEAPTPALTASPGNPTNLTCAFQIPIPHGEPAPTGTFTFTDSTAHQTLGRAPITAKPAQTYYPFTSVSISPTAYTIQIVSADSNGDGIPDLAGTDEGDGIAWVALGNGDGTFQPPAIYPVAGAGLEIYSSYGIVVGDFNHDGKPDLAVTNDDANGSVTILLGNGDGTFTPTATAPATVAFPSQVVVGDFNGDGKQDLAVVGTNAKDTTGAIEILLGDGAGGFTPKTTLLTGATEIVAGDFTGDGKLDLISGYQYGPPALVFLAGKGDGTFEKGQEIAASTQLPPQGFQERYSFIVGDFNGDGKPDLAVLVGSDKGTGEVVVLLGNGDRTFQYSSKLALGIPYPYSGGDLLAGKYTHGVEDDILFSDYSLYPASMIQLLQIEASGLSVLATYPAGGALVAGDFDRSGNLEFANSGLLGAAVYTPGLQIAAAGSVRDVVLHAEGIVSHQLECSYSGDAHYGPGTSEPATVKVLPRLQITWASPQAISYGAELTAKQLDAKASEPESFVYSPPRGTVLGAGMHQLAATFIPANPHEYSSESKTVEIQVNRAPLVVIAANATVKYDKPLPTLTYSFYVFVNGDTAQVVSGKPLETTTAKQGSLPGLYPIDIESNPSDPLRAANYEFFFQDAVLTILSSGSQGKTALTKSGAGFSPPVHR
jgi:hypothetical protein